MHAILQVIASVLFLVVGLISLLMARKSLFASTRLPFHEKAAGIPWDSLPAGVRSVYHALLQSNGLGFLVAGILTIGLGALELADRATRITILGSPLPIIFCAGLARINYRLSRETGVRTPWKGSLYAAAAILIALLAIASGGCTTSSILSDVGRDYAWQPSRTPYGSMVDQCAGKRVTLLFRDGRIREGFLVRASSDSIFWRADPILDETGCATVDLVQIREPFHLIPEIVGTVGGATFGALVGFGAALPQGESGGAHPVSPPDWPIYTCAGLGAFAGFFVGKGYSTDHLYLIDTVSLRHTRPTGGTP